jgi:hypothetical protein
MMFLSVCKQWKHICCRDASSQLRLLVEDITESIMKLVSQGNSIDDTITFMEDKTAEAMEHMNIVKREQQDQQQQQKQKQEEEDVEDQEIF